MLRLVCVGWVCALVPLGAAETLKDVLARIDRDGPAFRGLSAKLTKTTYTAVLQETTEEHGRIVMRRARSRQLEFLIDLTSPDEKAWSFRDRTAEAYYPKIKTVQVYDLGKYSRLVDQFMLLGFGASSAELEQNYSMRVAGEDSVEGKTATVIELIPKSSQAREHLKRVEIWVPHSSGYPVRQKFYQNSGDYLVVTYHDLKLEENLPESAVRLKLPAGVKREYPQK